MSRFELSCNGSLSEKDVESWVGNSLYWRLQKKTLSVSIFDRILLCEYVMLNPLSAMCETHSIDVDSRLVT